MYMEIDKCTLAYKKTQNKRPSPRYCHNIYFLPKCLLVFANLFKIFYCLIL